MNASVRLALVQRPSCLAPSYSMFPRVELRRYRPETSAITPGMQAGRITAREIATNYRRPFCSLSSCEQTPSCKEMLIWYFGGNLLRMRRPVAHKEGNLMKTLVSLGLAGGFAFLFSNTKGGRADEINVFAS